VLSRNALNPDRNLYLAIWLLLGSKMSMSIFWCASSGKRKGKTNGVGDEVLDMNAPSFPVFVPVPNGCTLNSALNTPLRIIIYSSIIIPR
jgi:hypothetical protein